MLLKVELPPKPRPLAVALDRRLWWIFVALVLLPTAIATVYFAFIASDRFVAEAKFIVRSVNGRGGGGLEAFLRTFGMSRAEDDAFAVHTFMQSRGAVQALQDEVPLRDMFKRSEADFLSRHPTFFGADTSEALYEYYQRRVRVSYQPSTGISTLRVSAFRGEDVERIANALLGASERLINAMNVRAHADALAYAENEVLQAEKKMQDAQAELTRYRNTELILDPSAASLKTIDLIGQLTAELAQTRLQLQETIRKSPSNPALQSLRVRVEALEAQIAAERATIVGGSDALASKIAAYERLVLQREFADKSLAGALATLDGAKQEARRQHLYIETVVKPTKPDEATEPRRLRNIVTVFVCTLAIYALGWLAFAGAREHRDG
jgi:capsular polysaccharide transport system permease protein